MANRSAKFPDLGGMPRNSDYANYQIFLGKAYQKLTLYLWSDYLVGIINAAKCPRPQSIHCGQPGSLRPLLLLPIIIRCCSATWLSRRRNCSHSFSYDDA